MLKNRALSWILTLVAVALLLTACGASPTPTPVPPTALPANPKPGVWHGNNGLTYREVLFVVGNDGTMNTFVWKIQPKGYNPCPIDVIDQSLPIDAGVFHLTAEKQAGGTAYDFSVIFRTETTAELTYYYDLCPSTFSISFNEAGETVVFTGTATAEWVQP